MEPCPTCPGWVNNHNKNGYDVADSFIGGLAFWAFRRPRWDEFNVRPYIH